MINRMYSHVRAIFRFLLFIFVISKYVLEGFIIYFYNRNPDHRRGLLTQHAHRTGIKLAQIFGVTVVCKNPIPHHEKSLLVGNHIGFIDILCLEAIVPSVFITSLEMRRTPGLGLICEVAGCAYVDRKNRMKIQEELKDIIAVLKKGFRVVLYAESTASNGEQVLPFKKTLMMAAGLADVPIRPFVFNFRSVNGGPVKFEHRDSLCWHGDISFLTSIWRSLQLDSLVCEIEFLPLVNVKAEDDRTEVAKTLHAMISERYVPFKQA